MSCKPRKTLIPLDAPYYDQYPFFADVFRCAGGCTTFNPTFYHCVAKTTNNVSGQVISLSLGTQMTVVVENHTSCDCACAKSATQCTENGVWNEDQCSCLCKYPNGPPSPCPTGLRFVYGLCGPGFITLLLDLLWRGSAMCRWEGWDGTCRIG